MAGFNCPYWLTFRQAKELGGFVRKGEHGSPVVYASTFKTSETTEEGAEVEAEIPFLKEYTVFNACQVEGLPQHYYELAEPPKETLERIQHAEAFFAATGAEIRTGGNQAYYAVTGDYIQMPPFESFRDAESHAATLAHELPFGTVLEFNKLVLARDYAELEHNIAEILDMLRARAASFQACTQRPLFDVGRPPKAAPAKKPIPAESVSSLAELVTKGRKFPTIYADPPWPYDNEASRAAAVKHYPTMSLAEIEAEPVAELAADDAHLHLWTTNGFLREAIRLVDAWGFEFKSCLVWVKDDLGMGNYWRVSHEFLLLGVRGSLTFRDRTLPSWIQAGRTIHSRKPGVVRTLIERVSPGPYLEIYGREEFPNSEWTVYGNQIEKRMF